MKIKWLKIKKKKDSAKAIEGNSKSYNNALEVKKEEKQKKNEKEKNKRKMKKSKQNEKETAQVSKAENNSFIKPSRRNFSKSIFRRSSILEFNLKL